MKRFFKRLYYGLDVLVVNTGGFLGGLLLIILHCKAITTSTGWTSVLFFIGMIMIAVLLIVGVVCIGESVEEYKQLKKDKEKEDNNA